MLHKIRHLYALKEYIYIYIYIYIYREREREREREKAWIDTTRKMQIPLNILYQMDVDVRGRRGRSGVGGRNAFKLSKPFVYA